MSDPLTDVMLAAAELKLTAMPQYQMFVRTLQVLESRLKDDLAAASASTIFTQQGKAQLMTQLMKKLEDPVKSRDELKRRI